MPRRQRHNLARTAADLATAIRSGDAYGVVYHPDRIAIRAGDVSVVLRNIGVVRHDLRVEGQTPLVAEAAPGQTGTATVAPALRY